MHVEQEGRWKWKKPCRLFFSNSRGNYQKFGDALVPIKHSYPSESLRNKGVAKTIIPSGGRIQSSGPALRFRIHTVFPWAWRYSGQEKQELFCVYTLLSFYFGVLGDSVVAYLMILISLLFMCGCCGILWMTVMDQKIYAQLRESMGPCSTTEHATACVLRPPQESSIWVRALNIGRSLRKVINNTVWPVGRWLFMLPWQQLCHLYPTLILTTSEKLGLVSRLLLFLSLLRSPNTQPLIFTSGNLSLSLSYSKYLQGH